jgi:spermidine dehydrogenase
MEDNDRNPTDDRELGMDRPITRRDFLNGVALTIGASLLPKEALADEGGLTVPSQPPEGHGADMSSEDPLLAKGITPSDPRYYPPTLTGMRGNHPGSFEAAHSNRDGDFWKNMGRPSDTHETYDLVVVGGGISGLAAAYFYRARTGPSARILILDNHDDFGGHAKRNEFHIDGHLLLMNGGTMSIESPFPYSPEASGLFRDLSIDPPALAAKCENARFYHSLGLKPAIFFDKETFGVDRLAVGMPGGFYGEGAGATEKVWMDFLSKTPLPIEVQRDMARVQAAKVDYMPGVPEADKKDKLARMSYMDFLLKVAKVHPKVIPVYQTRTHGLYGVGIDAVPALDCWAIGFPGFQGMNLARVPTPHLSFTAEGAVTPQKPYHFHYPDGNASIARMLVRSLIPDSIPGHTAQDIVAAKADYTRLDRADSPVRIRLNSTVVRVHQQGGPNSEGDVEVTYASQQKAYTVRAKGVVLACWNVMIPYLCPELPEKQKWALRYGVKVPLVYTTVGLRNWTAFEKLGVMAVSAPGMYHSSLMLNEVVDIGDYNSPHSPREPILLHMLRTPCKPGLSVRDQQRAGRFELFVTPFETFERSIRAQLGRILAGGGFDAARDIAAITVNRWSHGYAYEYQSLWDPQWPPGEAPFQLARKPFGKIAIANSDAAAAAYTDQAINQGYRAVAELTGSTQKLSADVLGACRGCWR